MKFQLSILSSTFIFLSSLNAAPQAGQFDFKKDIKPLLEKYCYNCHDEDTQKGDVQLDVLDPDVVKGKDAAHWHAALDILNTGDMPPPKKKKQPTDAERRKLVEWISANIKLARKLNKGKIQSVVRRLTRQQYSNSLNDILGIGLNVAHFLPPESPSKRGFLNDGARQFSSPLLLENYQEIARRAVKMAIGPAEKPAVYRYRVDFGKDISKQKNAQKGGAGSLSLSGHDFMPYVLDEKGLPLAAKAKMATGKKVSDVLKIISVGLRGSDKKRFYSKEKALVLYAGNPQPNEAPHSWTPPDPNVKLLIQRDFPSAGRFRYTVKASNSLSKKINTHFIDSTWDARGQRPRMDKIALQFAPLASWEYGKLEHSKKAIVIPVSSAKNLKNLEMIAGALVAKKSTEFRGRFQLSFNLPSAAYYQLDVLYKKIPTEDEPRSLRLRVDGFIKTFNYTMKSSADLHKPNPVKVNSLFNGYFKKGKGLLIFSNQIPAITHVVFTPLEGQTLALIKKLRAQKEAKNLLDINAYKDTPAVLRAFLGNRGDDGENYDYLENIQVVKGKPGETKEYIFEGRLENFPLPVINHDSNVLKPEDLSATMVLGIYNHHLAPKKGGIGPLLDIHSMTLEAPYYESWPAKDYINLFGATKPKHDLESTRKVIKRFVSRAFRKKVEKRYVDRYVKFWQEIKGQYQRYEDGVAEVLIAILCSPEFIYIAEPPTTKSSKNIDDFQLANRLSYFLWNRAPDAALLQAADSGKLSFQLDQQVERLLNDKRSEAFIKAFGSQWLAMERFENIDLANKMLFTPHIKEYMRAETHSFLKHILDENLSIKNFIDSDFVMLNEHLASYYKIKDVKGHEFRPVKVDRQFNRGGLLSQGSFLVGHSDGKHGHPIKRGVWLMKKILATEPPPPPPNVPTLDESIPGFDKMSVKQKLKVHSKKSSCKNCHAKIDPWGLAFEEYDALGLFHKIPGAIAVDQPTPLQTIIVQHKVLSGTKIDAVRLRIPGDNQTLNISEVEQTLLHGDSLIAALKKQLLEEKMDRVTLSVVEHLLSYSLGRELSYLDEDDVHDIVKASIKKGTGFRDIVKSIIRHDIFRRL
jgi:hypothetical protein